MRDKSPRAPPRPPATTFPAVSTRRRQRAAAIREDLAVELYTRMRVALGQLGLSRAAHARALERSQTAGTAPRVSGPLLRDTRGLCNILLEWSRDPSYLDAKGEPRVLPVRGPGATFETLVKRFLPKIALAEVVARACADADVATRPGGKIALLGGVLVNVVGSAEIRLAHAVRQIDQLLQTIVHNAAMHKKGLRAGRPERMVVGVISRRELARLIQEFRPQIDDLLQRLDAAVEPRQPKSARALKEAIVVGLSVFLSQEDDWERAGIDALPLVQPSRRKRPRKP